MKPDKLSTQALEQTPVNLNIEVAQFAPEDWALFKDLRLRALQTDPLAFGATYEEQSKISDEEWRARLENPAQKWFFSRESGKLIAMAGVNFAQKEHIKHRAEIIGVFVDSAYRKQGVGEDLMKNILENLKANPEIAKVALSVRGSQEAAKKLYEKLGFRLVGVHEKEAKIEGQYYDVIDMELIFPDKL